MKMVNDLMPHRTTSINNLEEDCIPKIDNATNVDQSEGDSKIFSGDLCDSKCHNKDTDSVPTNEATVMYSPGDFSADVEESRLEAGFDDVEPFGMCPSKIRADEENKVQSSDSVSHMELEHSVLEEHFRDADGGTVKDICIDEGVPVRDKILTEDITVDGLKCIVEDSNPAKDSFGSNNVTVEVEWPVPVGVKSMTDEACEKDFNSCESKVLILQSESESEATRLVSNDLLKEKTVDTVSVEETYAQEPLSKTSTEKLVADCEVAIGESTPETSIKETAGASRVETSNMIVEPAQEETNNSFLSEAVNNNDAEVASHPQMLDASHPPEPQKLVAENLTASAQLQRDHFESSFASAAIPYSGSLSHRSDASTVSTRSFAFPVLQNEWNFSPVRMRKAERRHLRRHRGWMHGLFCCKF
ncbi:hypothetical protein QQ045_017916 [Rhodiola kirilowii]